MSKPQILASVNFEQPLRSSLSIQLEPPSQWIAQGYTHIHFGAIHLALTYHARKGLPLCARIGLLDTNKKNTKMLALPPLKPPSMLEQ